MCDGCRHAEVWAGKLAGWLCGTRRTRSPANFTLELSRTAASTENSWKTRGPSDGGEGDALGNAPGENSFGNGDDPALRGNLSSVSRQRAAFYDSGSYCCYWLSITALADKNQHYS